MFQNASNIISKLRNTNVTLPNCFKRPRQDDEEVEESQNFEAEVVDDIDFSNNDNNEPDNRLFTALQLLPKNQCSLESIKELLRSGASVGARNDRGDTPLHMALKICIHDSEVIRQLLIYGASVFDTDHQKKTPLHLSLQYSKNNEIIFQILNCGANVNAKDIEGNSPLHIAVRNSPENFEIINELVRHGASCSESNLFGDTPLHLAISHNKSVKVIQKIIMNDSNVNAKNVKGNTPLLIALRIGPRDPGVIKELLKCGADVNVKNADGNTPLLLALQIQPTHIFFLEIFTELLKHGASVSERNSTGHTPLHVALMMCRYNIEVIRALLRHGASVHDTNQVGQTALHLALKHSKNTDIIMEILNAGADVKAEDLYNETPLYYALQYCVSFEVIEELLKRGASCASMNKWGDTPLTVALCRKRSFKVIQALLKHGADANAKKKNGNMPISIALRTMPKNLDIIKELLKYGAMVNIKDSEGKTPLVLALQVQPKDKFSMEVVMELLKHGASVFDKDEEGNTALHLACSLNDLHLIREVLKYGASIFDSNDQGETPLHVTLHYHGNNDVIMELLRCRSEVNAKDGAGDTTLHAALRNRYVNFDIITELVKRGACCRVPNYHGDTPLHVALKSGKCWKIVQVILKNQGNIYSRNKYDQTPFFSACDSVYDNSESIKELLNLGASVLDKDRDNVTVLHAAVESGKKIEIIQELIRRGADINAKDSYNKTPLARITYENFWDNDYWKLIMEYGASVHTSFDIDSLSILASCEERKLNNELIKCALIEHPDEIFCDYCESLKECFSEVVWKCKKEIETMKNMIICTSKNLTLYDFIVKREYDYGKEFSKDEDILLRGNYFSDQFLINFHNYRGLIRNIVETRIYLFRYLYDICFYTKRGDSVHYLNSGVLQVLGKFLSNKDLKNVIIAFHGNIFIVL